MVKVSEGKYRVGDSNTLIFIRVSLGRRGLEGAQGVSRIQRPAVGLYLGLKVRKGDHHPPLVIHHITIHQLSIPLSLCEFQKIPGKVGRHVPHFH